MKLKLFADIVTLPVFQVGNTSLKQALYIIVIGIDIVDDVLNFLAIFIIMCNKL